MKDHTDERQRTVSTPSNESTAERGHSRRTFLGGTAAALGLAGLPIASAQDDGSLAGIVESLTLDEKISLLHQNEDSVIPSLPEHDVPKIDMRDAPHRVRTMRKHPDITVFPSGLTAASTFDPALVHEQGAAIAREVKADDGNSILGPGVNINRVPVGGRTWEYYGEDPYLTAQMAAEYTKGCQSEDVIATVKHFVANNQEAQREEINVDVSERALREIYYPGYKAAVQDGGAGAVMNSLNKVNGEYASENEDIQLDALKSDWGFEGFTICDFGGVHSVVDAALSGNDVELVSGEHFGEPLKQAVKDGIVPESKIDDMVHRVLWALESTGAMGGIEGGASATDEHFSVAQQIAEEGSVLLKNEDDVLPLDENEIDELAVVGPEPNSFIIKEPDPSREIGLVDGIEQLVDNVEITTVSTDPFRPVKADFQAEYFTTGDLSGDAGATENVQQVQVDNVVEASGLNDVQSARWTAQIDVTTGGTYGFSIETHGAATVSIDGETVLETEVVPFGTPSPATTEYELEAGQTYELELEVTGVGAGDSVFFDWDRPDVDPVRTAATTANEADAAIAIVQSVRSEGNDLEDMSLPSNQEELVHHVGSAAENSVVLVNAGGPVRMEWIEFVDSTMHVWYPGQEGGTAVANLLFGRSNPSGKLPMTLGKTMWDYPADDPSEYPGEAGAVHYDEGVFVGYRYFDEHGVEPLFPFGHGETYTEFEYSDLQITPSAVLPASPSLTVRCAVENTGDRDGTEVVQVYLGDEGASVDRPPKELVAFERVEIPAGEEREITLELGEEAFQYYDPEDGWSVDPSTFTVSVGSSSQDVRLEDQVRIIGR